MRFKLLFIPLFIATACTSNSGPKKIKTDEFISQKTQITSETLTPTQKIQVALILDTSNSMDGLIEQAKSQLWTIVNHISRLKFENEAPKIEISLYEYGNDLIPFKDDFVRKLTNLTTELDSVSECLFALNTNGGEEFCGAVINQSLSQLEWKNDKSSYKVIFIAGNEPFDQGTTPFSTSCDLASTKDVYVNTIFCGDAEEGVRTHWKDGASSGNGIYMSISQDEKTQYVNTPFDDSIMSLNDSLNGTYLYYGSLGNTKFNNVSTQDGNSRSYGIANNVERTVSKSRSVYDNTSWDLVDASKKEGFDINKIEKSSLPEHLQNCSSDKLTSTITYNAKHRVQIQRKIQDLNKKRLDYIAKVNENENPDGLENAIVQAIISQASSKGFTYE